jgi:hypothetical protein
MQKPVSGFCTKRARKNGLIESQLFALRAASCQLLLAAAAASQERKMRKSQLKAWNQVPAYGQAKSVDGQLSDGG